MMEDRNAKGQFVKGNQAATVNLTAPPPEAAEVVFELCSRGVCDISVAKALGTSNTVYARWREAYPEIEEARRQGRAVEHDALFDVLFQAAVVEKNLTAAMFLLKARHGYREQGPDFTQVENKVSVTFELPGALKPDVYEAEVLKKSLPPRQRRRLIRG
jgi:hypothetical protein